MRPVADAEVIRDSSHAIWGPRKPYAFICPGCQARYGAEQADRMVDIKRCSKCISTRPIEANMRHESVKRRP